MVDKRGELRPASSAGRRRQLNTISAGTGQEAMLDLFWEADAALKSHAGSRDGATAIELSNELVTWLVLVCYGEKRRMYTWA